MRRGKYPQSDPAISMERGNHCTAAPKQQIFRFNPSKDLKIFPPKHPYLPKGCGECDKRMNFAAYNPKKEICLACRAIRNNNVSDMLDRLHELKGADYIRQLRAIVELNIYHKVEKNIMSAIGENNPDYKNLLAGARKAVAHGYTVYMLPNPGDVKSADYIFVRKNLYKSYDLKTISGIGSIGSRLEESKGQTRRFFLNLKVKYPANKMALEIKRYFESNEEAMEVIVAVGNKLISVDRNFISDRDYNKLFRGMVEK